MVPWPSDESTCDELHAQFVTFSYYRPRRIIRGPRRTGLRGGSGVWPDTISKGSPLGTAGLGIGGRSDPLAAAQHRRFCERIESYGKVFRAKIVAATQNDRATRDDSCGEGFAIGEGSFAKSSVLLAARGLG